MRAIPRAWGALRPRGPPPRRPASLGLSFRRLQSSACYPGSLGAFKKLLKVSEEVADAVATNKPVVALESTIYTHGALGNDLDLEGIVRRNGAVPAVVGVLAGVPTVGLLPDEVTRMVQNSPRKVSRRDISHLVGMGMLGQKMHGGTTIAGTMILARLAGIRVFGTGGLGGVHRDGQDSLDISADLTELGRTRMAVISSGCKGFLDIPRTLEYLETQGVVVSTFADGRSGAVDFPAFWARDSGVKSPSVVDNEEQAAAMILAQESLEMESGLLFGNPIGEAFSIAKAEMDAVIEQAVRESSEQGASGNENTPFILKRIKELTHGRSVAANKVLVQANVARAAKIAVAVSRLISGDLVASSTSQHRQPHVSVAGMGATTPVGKENQEVPATSEIMVAGSVAVDLSCNYTGAEEGKALSPALHTSNPSSISQSIGGVGRNVALAAHRVRGDTHVRLYSMIGDDIAGSAVLTSLESAGMDTSAIQRLDPASGRTAQYVAVNDGNKNLVMAMADMGIFTTHSSPAHWNAAVAASKPSWLVVDANWGASGIRSWTTAGKRNGARVAFEPVSNAKSAQLFCGPKGVEALGVYPTPSVDLASPNQHELAALHAAAQQNGYLDDPRWWAAIDALGMTGARDRFVKLTSASMTDRGIPQQAVQLLPYIPTVVTKVGEQGALLTALLGRDDARLWDPASEPFILCRSPVGGDARVGGVYMRLFPAVERVRDVVSVNGVGDTFLGVLVAGLAQGGRVEDLVDTAQKGAVMTLKSPESVSAELAVLQGELAAAARMSKAA